MNDLQEEVYHKLHRRRIRSTYQLRRDSRRIPVQKKHAWYSYMYTD